MSKKTEMSRRRFVKNSIVVTVGSSMAGQGLAHALGASDPSKSRTGVRGVAMVTSRQYDVFRVDLISLSSGEILKTFDDFHAAHAVVPVEELNRFFVHGRDLRTGKSIYGINKFSIIVFLAAVIYLILRKLL